MHLEPWLLYAILAAVFAGLTTILAKIGIEGVNSHLATAIRTVVVVIFAWLMVLVVGSGREIVALDGRTWLFLSLSGLSTGASWLCFFHALKIGTVSNVSPLKKSSTVSTMLLAIFVLQETATVFMWFGIGLIALGTYLMLDKKEKLSTEQEVETRRQYGWLFWGILAALFASLTAIFGKIGIEHVDANLGNAIRTMLVLPTAWVLVFLTGKQKGIRQISRKSWLFLLLSGLATGGSWLFFYRALQIGNASLVVPIDKLSIVITIAFARIFFGEKMSPRRLVGLVLLVVGTLLPIVFGI